MEKLAEAALSPGNVYFTGGVTMLLFDCRDQTIDIDLKLDPEPDGVFEGIASLKNELDINIELAAPDQFIPPPSDWREKSIFIRTVGKVSFFHYDLATQALAKLERGHEQDLLDIKALIEKGLINLDHIRQTFTKIKSSLIRYPAIDEREFERKMNEFLEAHA